MQRITLTKNEKRRIFSKIVVDPNTQCWNWTGAKDRRYGVVRFRGGNQKTHRLLYAVFVGPLPIYNRFNVLDHVICNNTLCCNPKHVKLVKQSFNVLRTNSVSGINSRKTHCIRGHPLPEAKEPMPNGNLSRRCVICRNINKRRRYHTKKGSI